MSLTVDDLKNQLRIDGNDDDSFVKLLICRAQEFIINAIDSNIDLADYQKYEIFDQAVSLLVGFWYFHRYDSMDTQVYPLPYGIDAIINQLRGELWTTTQTTTDGDG